MNLRNKKLLAAKVLDVGLNRVRFDEERLNDIKEAITKRDIHGLINGGAISIKKENGTSSFRHKKRLLQKRKGRRQGGGSRKGKKTARLRDKESWMNRIRKQRKYLIFLKGSGYISRNDFRLVYKKAGGGFFRSKRHVKTYLQENKLIKEDGKAKKETGKEDRL